MQSISNATKVLASFRKGDERAFATIFEFFYPKLIIAAYRIVKNESEAQDIASKVLEKLYSRSQMYESIEHLTSFLYLATRNESINYLKFQKSRNINHNQYVKEQFDDVDLMNNQLDGAFLDKIYHSIDKLPAKSKQVINYLYIERLPYHKIADIMGTTVKNIENIRSYALHKLRLDLDISNLSSENGHLILVVLFAYFLPK